MSTLRRGRIRSRDSNILCALPDIPGAKLHVDRTYNNNNNMDKVMVNADNFLTKLKPSGSSKLPHD